MSEFFRLARRTLGTLFGKRAPISNANDGAAVLVYARSGLFETPAAVGLITGAISAGINLLPPALLGLNYHNVLPFTFIIFMTLTTLCSGPFLLTLASKSFFSLLRFTFFLTLVAMLPLFLIYQAHIYLIYRIFYSISVAFRIVASWLIGRHLARNYGALNSLRRCGLLGIAGNLPMIAFECYQLWKWDVLGQREQLSRELLAFYVMAFLISQIGVATLPALASEREFRERVTASKEKLTAAQA